MTTAVVLHQRPFGETSQIISLFTERCGRIDVSVRASRTAKFKAMAKPLPFTLLQVSWAGRGQLPYLVQCDARTAISLNGRVLYCGLYLNELLYYLLPQQLAEPTLFSLYWHTLQQLAAGEELERCLRRFEWRLLAELGYGLQLDCAANGEPLKPQALYSYRAEYGLLADDHGPVVASGSAFASLADGQFGVLADMLLAKRLMRYVLQAQLGGRQLSSRQLFR